MNIKTKIIECFKNLEYNIGEDGYFSNEEDNLLENYPNWIEIQNEINKGRGSELKPKSTEKAKFLAVYSSCALCVNNFALIKYYKDNVTLFGSSGFIKAEFEKENPTYVRGNNPSYPDFYLENDKIMIGIESKFTEHFEHKLVHTNINLNSYHNHQKLLTNLDPRLNDVIKFYIDCKEALYLDAAQLIKHMVGLSWASKNNKKAKLVYLYWIPSNYMDKEIYEIYQKHEEELKTFKDQIKNLPIYFESYSYLEFWKMMEKNAVLADIVKKIKKRYEFAI